MFLGLITILISIFNSLFENDMKKITAFSSLRQLGLIIILIKFYCKMFRSSMTLKIYLYFIFYKFKL